MCLYPGLCELKIILVHEIIAVFWALLIKKQECFHRWEEMYWQRMFDDTMSVSMEKLGRGCICRPADLWTSFRPLAALMYVNWEDSFLL